MTPKEKAKDLYNQFYSYNSHPNSVAAREKMAKQGASICVDEMIRTFIGMNNNMMGIVFTSKIEYWNEVQEEINKL